MCGLETGDLLGTGTISGDVGVLLKIENLLLIIFTSQAVDDQGNKKELGCLYEATQGGSQFISLQDGTQMKYLQDEDEIVLEGWCEDEEGKMVLGFGECRGTLLPAFKN
jgi:fumarylacetoacetase